MQTSKKPNILFLISDQQRADTLEGDFVLRPNIDRLAARGTKFRRAFCCGATCVASRCALFTGLYAHTTGVYSFDRWDHQRTWLHDLRENGYYLTNIGKMHHTPIEAQMAFHERFIYESSPSERAFDDWGKFLRASDQPNPYDAYKSSPQRDENLTATTFPLEERYHVDVLTGATAVDWLSRYRREEPFFLQVGFPGPHEPYDPCKRHLEMYKDAEVPPCKTREGELENKPPEYRWLQDHFANTSSTARIDFRNATPERIAEMKRHYFAKITAIDEQVGRILDTLEAREMLDNTIIVFTSDHGDNLGDHGMPYKWVMTDPAVHVPMILAGPGIPGGVIDDGLFSHIDLGPTLLHAAGVPLPCWLQGKSRHNRIFASDREDCPDAVYCQDNYLTMVRTPDWKLVHYAGCSHGELYDLQNDPEEFENLYGQECAAKAEAQLKSLLLEWFALSSYLGSPVNVHGDASRPRRHPFNNPEDPARLIL